MHHGILAVREVVDIVDMHFKKKIVNKVYHMYLRGTTMEVICMHMRLSDEDVEEIIDFMNEIYV